jgi:hypothetical protein
MKTGLRLALPALLIFALAAAIGVSPLGHRAAIGRPSELHMRTAAGAACAA